MKNQLLLSKLAVFTIAMGALLSCQQDGVQKENATNKIKPINGLQKNEDLKSNIKIGRSDNRSRSYTFDKGLGLSVGVIDAVVHTKTQVASCTATIIGDGYIVTAAHCLFHIPTGIQYIAGSFYPGIDGGSSENSIGFKFKKAWVLKKFYNEVSDFAKKKRTNQTSAKKYYNQAANRSDLAIIQVETRSRGLDLYDDFGFMDFGGINRLNHEKSTMAKLYAYPGDKPKNTQWSQNCHVVMYQDSERGYTTCDTYAGTSGAALKMWSSELNRYVIQAIYTADDGEQNLVYVISLEDEKEMRDILNNNTRNLKLFKELNFEKYY